MDTNAGSSWEPLAKLVSNLKLLPLIESSELVWPSRLDIQLMAPTYETDLHKMKTLLEDDPSQLLQESEDNDVLRFQVSFISCCYESTAFMLSEELAAELQTLREEFVWGKLMKLTTSDTLISKLFEYYRRTLLGEDWFYQFGDVTSFCSFVWDLVAFDRDMRLIDRNGMQLVEQFCFKLMRSKKVQLFVKGVMVLEECIHKARDRSLMDYEMVYRELEKQKWRLLTEDERSQNASIILLTGMLECVKVLEVDRNQLMTLISNFSQICRADDLMKILLKGLKLSTSVGTSIALLDVLLQLLAVDHDDLRIVPEEPAEECDLDEVGFPLILMNGTQRIDTYSDDWWKDIIDQNRGRFHRWTKKLFKLLMSEIGKYENFNVTHFQYLSYAMFFTIHSGESVTTEQIECIFQSMVSFVKRMVNRIETQITSGMPTNSTLRNCMRLVAANVACTIHYGRCMSISEPDERDVSGHGSLQTQSLNKLLLKVQHW